LAGLAAEIVALRRSGSTVRAIAAHLGISSSGVHGLLARLGLAGERPRRDPRRAWLPERTRGAIALLTDTCARRLTWRERVVLQGRVRGDPVEAIATDLGIRPGSVNGHVAAARGRLARPWRRRSRARRRRCDLAAFIALMEKVQH